jgi:hypothetical protein
MTSGRLDKIATIEDLAHVSRRRIPKITLGYLESGPGGEIALRRNREALDRVGNLTELRSRGASTSEKIGTLVTGRAIVRSYSSAIADFR